MWKGSYLKAMAHSKSDDNGDILSAVRSHYYCRPAHQHLLASFKYWWSVSRPTFRSKRFWSILNSKKGDVKNCWPCDTSTVVHQPPLLVLFATARENLERVFDVLWYSHFIVGSMDAIMLIMCLPSNIIRTSPMISWCSSCTGATIELLKDFSWR